MYVHKAEYSFLRDLDLSENSSELNVKQVYDSYGGFPREGQHLYRVTLASGGDTSSIIGENWLELPLPKELYRFLYDDLCETKAEQVGLPQVNEGCWLLSNRSNYPGSYNFTLAIYSSTEDVLYVYETDT